VEKCDAKSRSQAATDQHDERGRAGDVADAPASFTAAREEQRID
jgi:hypothetical protein